MSAPKFTRPDISLIQDVEIMKALPPEERRAAAQGLYLSLQLNRKRDVAAVVVEGRIAILVHVDGWWYHPHKTLGWRCPDLQTSHPNKPQPEEKP